MTSSPLAMWPSQYLYAYVPQLSRSLPLPCSLWHHTESWHSFARLSRASTGPQKKKKLQFVCSSLEQLFALHPTERDCSLSHDAFGLSGVKILQRGPSSSSSSCFWFLSLLCLSLFISPVSCLFSGSTCLPEFYLKVTLCGTKTLTSITELLSDPGQFKYVLEEYSLVLGWCSRWWWRWWRWLSACSRTSEDSGLNPRFWPEPCHWCHLHQCSHPDKVHLYF